jgi:putative ABC transport system permease protein
MIKIRVKPPAFAAWILACTIRNEDCLSILSDFSEIFEERAGEQGYLAACCWYWAQVARSIPMFILNYLCWGGIMFKNYLKIAFRVLKRHKGYSFLNIVGLAIGVACSLFVFLFIWDELSYDRFHEKADRIYRIAQHIHIEDRIDSALPTPPILADTLLKDFPQIDSAARVHKVGWSIVKYGENSFEESNIYGVDSSFFEVFSFKLIQGDPQIVLADPNTVVLSQSTARKYFGGRDPLGQVLKIRQNEFTVTGIIEDTPRNSHFHFDFLTSISTYPRSRSTKWFDGFCATYIVLQIGESPEKLESQFPEFVLNYMFGGKTGSNRMFKDWEYFLQPLTDIHLHSHLVIGEFELNSHVAYVYIFSIIAVFVLLIGCINFVNLSTAKAGNRAREVGIRKVVGSNRSQLIRQFLGESLLFSIIAFVLAFILIAVFMPAYESLIGKDIPIQEFITISVFVNLVVLIFVVGIGSGLYPAVVLSSFRPAAVIKGSGFATQRFRSSALRKGLIVFQFSISIFLFIGMGVVYQQTEYFQNKRLGFDREHVIVVKNANLLGENMSSFKTMLLQYPDIQRVSATSSLPGRDTSLRFTTPEGSEEGVVLAMFDCDQDYLDTLKLQMAEGRFFSQEFSTDNRAVIINQETARQLGWSQPIGKAFRMNKNDYHVIGVLEDFHFSSLHEKIDKMGILYTGEDRIGNADLFAVRVRPTDIRNVLQIISRTWESFSPPLPLDCSFLDQDYAQLYDAEMRIRNMTVAFSLLAILISSLGLFGLAAFTAEQRRKEFGVRKVLGASISDILALMSKDFLKSVVIANAAAWPVAYMATRQWLQNFAYRIPIRIEVFLVSGVFALIIAGLTVSYKSIKAATANPADSLRYE